MKATACVNTVAAACNRRKAETNKSASDATVIDGRYRFGSAMLGGLVWLAILAVPAHGEVGIGTIERLFLLAPLVLVPLALQLAGRNDSSVLYHRVTLLQPFAAVLAAASFLLPQGTTAALLASPWLLVTMLAGWCGLRRLQRHRLSSAAGACFAAGLLMLPIGGIGLVQSRLGASPLGFYEPWVLLVAVHFHYAAFLAPIIVGTTGMRLAETRPSALMHSLLCFVAFNVIVGSPLMASGFVFHLPWLRSVAAFMLAIGLLVHSLLLATLLPAIRPGIAQALLAVSAASVVVAMWFAILFTLGDVRGELWIGIPQMARVHGMLNAFGFSLCGLLGWNLAAFVPKSPQRRVAQRRPQTLLSRWE